MIAIAIATDSDWNPAITISSLSIFHTKWLTGPRLIIPCQRPPVGSDFLGNSHFHGCNVGNVEHLMP